MGEEEIVHRRNMLKAFGVAGAGLLAAPGPLAQAQETARRALPLKERLAAARRELALQELCALGVERGERLVEQEQSEARAGRRGRARGAAPSRARTTRLARFAHPKGRTARRSIPQRSRRSRTR